MRVMTKFEINLASPACSSRCGEHRHPTFRYSIMKAALEERIKSDGSVFSVSLTGVSLKV